MSALQKFVKVLSGAVEKFGDGKFAIERPIVKIALAELEVEIALRLTKAGAL